MRFTLQERKKVFASERSAGVLLDETKQVYDEGALVLRQEYEMVYSGRVYSQNV